MIFCWPNIKDYILLICLKITFFKLYLSLLLQITEKGFLFGSLKVDWHNSLLIFLSHSFVKAYRKIDTVLEMMSYFGLRDWKFCNNNVLQLNKLISYRNRQLYSLDFEMEKINWSEYFRHYIPGIKKYHFKEDVKNLQKSQMHYKRLYILHRLVKTSFWSLISYLLFRQFFCAFEKFVVN